MQRKGSAKVCYASQQLLLASTSLTAPYEEGQADCMICTIDIPDIPMKRVVQGRRILFTIANSGSL
ncbi:MAG: hypothetical protein JMM79_01735 [Candidatus Xiphinematobacter sp.]|nr:MAG: hypothetical protein JMM79_01735 [Candidatus Xiphinematobacter sp.]